MLNASITDEYRAYYTYKRVVLEFADPKPFSNIVEAEWQHIGAVSTLFESRGLAIPTTPYTLDNVPGFSTLTSACGAGVDAEVANWTMYDGFLKELRSAGALPADVENVFTSLMEASRDRHLPAFTNCAK